MSNTNGEIIQHLPMLRRYARCLTGSQDRGDQYVRICLESLLADSALLSEHRDPRLALFCAFHRIWNGVIPPLALDPLSGSGGVDKLERHIRALPPVEREVLLLTTLCTFLLDEVAVILDIPREYAEERLERAREGLAAQTRTSVLIIEDEPVIAFDLARLVGEMGHSVAGIADSQARAVSLARTRRPGVVLADIQLRGPGNGIDAAREIVDAMNVPVIFVTAFPERLLQGEPDEPTYLITKPFVPEVLQVTISQALLLHAAPPAAAAG